ncbi:hypothetical protein AS156_16035 [Bradyrhizobium macuxiense]|uniref:Uncharacterized protein n=1 Tax=Bradyrhizobium macuxiense TaxID=1755647 RepID=A0A109JIG7_9BRAD|nr:hypothetical protein AS156_16035 [Bradyrhizobium macuxiense]
MCAVRKVSPAAYYAWRALSERAPPSMSLVAIRQIIGTAAGTMSALGFTQRCGRWDVAPAATGSSD